MVPESTDNTLVILFVIDVRLYNQSEILSRRVYSVCKNIHYVQDFRNFISRFIRKLIIINKYRIHIKYKY
jgi:hypothetical protein